MLTKITHSIKIPTDAASLTLLFIALSKFSLRERLLQIESKEESKEVLEFFGGTYGSTKKENSYTWEEAPDICANCLTLFGLVVGGRVRTGCPHCRGCREEVRMAVIFFTSFSNLMPEDANFILAIILTEHFTKEEN